MKQATPKTNSRRTLRVSGEEISVPTLHTSTLQTETSGITDWRAVVGMFIASQDVKDSSRSLYTRTLSQFFLWIVKTGKELNSLDREDILEKLGADRVIIPEREVADKLALGMTHAGIMEYIELSQEFGVVEMEPVPEWIGKSIRELEMRTRYGINVIAVRKADEIVIPPDIDTPIEANVIMVMLGKYELFENLKKN